MNGLGLGLGVLYSPLVREFDAFIKCNSDTCTCKDGTCQPHRPTDTVGHEMLIAEEACMYTRRYLGVRLTASV